MQTAGRYWIAALCAIVLVAGTGIAMAATGVTVFVAPSGDDAAAGTAGAPVRSLSRARDLARAHAPGATVQLADGTYRMTTPLVLDARDSGVTWTAAPDAHPVVTGGVRVTGWTKSGSLWSAPLSVNTRQLYTDG